MRIAERLGPESRRLLTYFAASRAFVFIVGIIAVLYLPKFPWYTSLGGFIPIDMWVKWDGLRYLEIADQGYSYVPGEVSNTAWFPLYPLLIKLASPLLGSAVAGVVISNLALLAAIFVLYRLVKIDFPGSTSYNTILYTVIFPGSFFFSAIHTESLFLLLSVGSFYFARLGRWREAGILGFLSALTRPVGIVLFPVLLVEYAHQNGMLRKWGLVEGWRGRIRKNVMWLILVPLGTAAFSAYLFLAFGDPLLYIKSQALVGGALAIPFISSFQTLGNPALWLPTVLGILFMIFGFATLVYMLKRLRPSYIAYTLLSLLFVLFTTSVRGSHRYVNVIFPSLMALAMFAGERKIEKHITYLFIFALAEYTFLFVNGWLL